MSHEGRGGSDAPTPDDRETRHEVVRRANVELVFRGIADHAPVSRATLVGLTGLSKPTVLRLVAALESEGLIRRSPRSERTRPGAGRIPIRYEPEPRAGYVIGVDVGGTKTRAALADLVGTVVAEVEAATDAEGGEALVRQVAQLARSVAHQAEIPWERVAAITVGIPGVENPDGTIRLAANVADLDTVRVGHLLRRSLRTSVQLENDVNLAALGESEAGAARSVRTFALLALGTGIGMGLVMDDRLVRGSRGAGGEVGYLPIGTDPAEDRARRHGALEVAAAGRGLTVMVAEELARRDADPASRAVATDLGPESSALEIYAAASLGDRLAWRVIERQAEMVARAILSIACLLDPELIVLGGGIGGNPLLLAPVQRALDRIMPWPIDVVTCALGARSGVIGALHHARRSVPRIEAARVSARIRARERAGP